MLRRTAKLGVVAVLLLALLVVGTYAAWVGLTGSPPHLTETTRACEQPGSVTYSDGTYSVWARTARFELALATSRPEAFIDRGPDHGTPVVLAHGTEVDEVTCTWDAEGVTITDGAGISHRAPASVFTGGR